MAVTKKIALSILIIFLLVASLAFAFAQTDDWDEEDWDEEEEAEIAEAGKVSRAYNWLSDQVKDGWPASIEDDAFALLALAYDDKLASQGRKALLGKRTDGGWQGIKQTALALLALGRLGEETTEIGDWLLSKSKTFEAAGLEWLIQIDLEGNTSCEVSYADKSDPDEVLLYEDKIVKLHANESPRCLSDSTIYWLKISSDEECLKETYSFYCDDYVKASLLYKKGKTWFVPSKTVESNSFDLKIESVCLAEGDKCDYEGTLWAAYALAEQGRDINLLLPYLVAQADSEGKYLPDAFLYILIEDSDYADALLALQDKKGFWDERYKFYDTALASLALKYHDYYGADESLEDAKKYLLGHQTTGGSWGGSIRDTAFILYALWPKEAAFIELENECTTQGYRCRTSCIEYDEVEAEEYSYSCDIEEVCCKPEEVITECSEEGYTCCIECELDYDTYEEYDESCGWRKVCCEECAIVEEELPECEDEGHKCCMECDYDYDIYEGYDGSCPGFAICCEECAEEIEICDNEFDDDDDGLVDCEDPDCATFEKCQPRSKLWLFLLLLAAALVGLYFFLKKKGFKPREFLAKHKLFRRFWRQPPRFGGKPAEVLTRPRPRMLLRRPFRKPGPPVEKKTEKTETEAELEKTLRKLKKIGE